MFIFVRGLIWLIQPNLVKKINLWHLEKESVTDLQYFSIDDGDNVILNYIIEVEISLENLLDISPLKCGKQKYDKTNRLIEMCTATTSPMNDCEYLFLNYNTKPEILLKPIKANLLNYIFLQSIDWKTTNRAAGCNLE